MAKDFKKSMGSKNLSSLIPTEEPEVVEKEVKPKKVASKKTESAPKAKKSKTAESTVTTFRINNDLLESVKAIAFWERKKIQDVLNEALSSYMETVPGATLKKAKAEFAKRKG